MDLKEFINSHDVDYSSSLVSENKIAEFENDMDVKIGNELKQYILTYGYLGYKYIEFYGINSRQGSNSDMIKTTQYLHAYFEKTKHYIALEDQGDGDYYLVDENDIVYRYLSSRDEITNTNISLFDYIMERFCAA